MDDDPIVPQPPGVAIDDHIIFILDQTHPNFKQNCGRAVRYGFRHPILSTKFLDVDIKIPHLFLYHKFNDEYSKEIDKETIDKQEKYATKNMSLSIIKYLSLLLIINSVI
jgi:hypothetical protein